MIQARSVYPKVLAFAICKTLRIKSPRVIVQVWDKDKKKWKTGAVEL